LAEAKRLNEEVKQLSAQGRYREATPKARQALAIRERALGREHPDTAKSLNNLAYLLQAQGDYAAARPLYDRALAICERVQGKEHPDTAQILNNLAVLLQAQGDYAAAKPLYERALAIRERVKGKEHPDTAQTLHNLAWLLQAQGDYAAAKPLYERALTILERVKGQHPDTAQTLNNLAMLLQAQGDYAAAKPLYERALAIRERVLGKEHPDTAQTLNNLGNLLQVQGDYAAAKPLYERALAIFERVKGQHPDTAQTLNNLALLLHDQGDYAAAKPLHERALAIRERVKGKEHPDTAQTLHNLAWLLHEQGDYAAAKPLYERALAIRERVLGKEHPDTAQTLNNLAWLLWAQGDYAAAKPLYERALAIRERVLGKEHPDTAQTLNNLAGLLWAQGDYAAAKPLYERTLAIRERALGKEHPDTAQTLNNLAVLLEAQGDYAAAKPLYERALAIFERVKGREHSDTAASLNNLAGLLHKQGDYAAAKPLYERALAIRERVKGREHSDTAQTLNNLAELLRAQGDYTAARPLYERTLAIFERVLGREHPDTAACLNNLALLLQAQGDYTAARPLSERALAIRERALGREHPDTAKSLHNLAWLLHEQGDYAAARPLYERTLAIFERVKGRDHPDTAQTLNNLSDLHWAQGDVDGAEILLKKALEITRSNLRLAAAGQSERQQLAMTQALRSRLDAALSLDRQAKHTGEGAYRSVLSWKGAVFAQQREVRVFRRVVQRAGGQPEIIQMFDDLQDTTRRLATLALAVPPDPKQQSAWRRQVADQTERKEHLEVELARRSAEFRRAQSRREMTPEWVQAALPDGVVLVDLLEYTDSSPPPAGKGQWKWERRLVAFVVRRDHPIHRLDLGPVAPITAAVDRWRKTYGSGPTPREDDPAAELRRRVWEPLEGCVRDARMVLVSPDGALARLPLSALPGREPGTYLIEERAIAVVPVPQLLPELLEPAAQPPGASEGLLLVGDIDYGASPGTATDPGAGRPGAGKTRAGAWSRFRLLPALEATRGEIVTVRDTFEQSLPDAPVHVLRGGQATEEAFRQRAPRHRYLHLATHGYFAPEELRSALAPEPTGPRPAAGPMQRGDDPFGGQGIVGFHPGLLSGLALAGANRTPEPGKDDGVLTALEVAELDLEGVDLTVLSACETGLGEPAGGEGLLGLQRAFQEAGARGVVASLWSTEDEPTRALMVRFYENLWQKRMGKLEALREAQLWMLREGRVRGLVPLDEEQPASRPGRVPPRYWAAFILSGDWR